MTTRKNTMTKKVLALVLTVVMALGYVGLLSGLVGKDLFGTGLTANAASEKLSSVTMSDLTFIVPEAIYLYPNATAWKDTTSTPFQYYINNSSSGAAIQNTKDSTGYIYVTYPNFSGKASLSYSFVDGSFNTISGGSVTLSKSSNISSGDTISITAGSSPSLAASTTGCYILWTLSYKDAKDNINKTAYALTYVYKPYTVPAGVLLDIKEKQKPHWNKQISWMVGFHGITDGNSGNNDGLYYPYYTGDWGLAAFASSDNKAYIGNTEITSGSNTIQRDISEYTTTDNTSDNTGEVKKATAARWYLLFSGTGTNTYHLRATDLNNKDEQNWFSTSNNANSTYPYPFVHGDDTDNDQNHIMTATARYRGTITIDTSRYTNLTYVPNLSVGLMVVSDESSSSGGQWYVADMTDKLTNGAQVHVGNQYANSSDNAEKFLNMRNYIIAGQYSGRTSMNWNETEGVRYAGPWYRPIISGNTKEYIAHTMYANVFRGTWANYYVFTHGEISLHATQYNKSSLRSAVIDAIKKFPALGVNGISSGNIKSCYFDDNTNYKWTAFCDAFKSAYLALTKVDGSITDPGTLASTLNNALNALCTKVTFQNNNTAAGTVAANSGKTNPAYVTVGANPSVNVKPSDHVTVTANTGYTFEGWSTDPDDTSGSANTTAVTLGYNQTLYAIWSINPGTYTLNYNNVQATPEDSRVDTGSYDIETPFDIPNTGDDLVKGGYTYTGKWKVTSTGGNWPALNAADPNDLLFDGGTDSTGYYGNVTLTAQYTVNNYTLHFVTPTEQGANAVADKPYTCESTDPLPGAFWYGHEFTGWKVMNDAEHPFDPDASNWSATAVYTTSTLLTYMYGDVYLEAQWDAATYDVNLTHAANEAWDALNNTSATLTYSFVQGLTSEYNTAVGNPTRYGYDFLGWKVVAPAGESNSYYTTFYNNYQNDNNVTLDASNMWAISGSDVDFAPETGRSYVELDGGKIGAVWLKAVWSAPAAQKITYYLNDDAAFPAAFGDNTTVTSGQQTYYITDTALQLNVPSRLAWVFKGWNVQTHAGNWNSTGSGDTPAYPLTDPVTTYSGMYGDVSLVAQWEEQPYTLTLALDGGTLPAGTETEYTFDVNHGVVSLPQPAKTGQTFDGWKILDGGFAAQSTWAADANALRDFTTSFGTGYYGDVTLTAQWAPIEYTVTLNTAGSLPDGTPDTITYYYGEDVTLPTTQKTGYTFLKWKVTLVPDATDDYAGNWSVGATYDAETAITGMYGNATISASLEDADCFTPLDYTITYKKADGAVWQTPTYQITDTVTIADYPDEVGGRQFLGWSLSALAGDNVANSQWRESDPLDDSTLIAPGQYAASTHWGSFTLTPKFAAVGYTVTYQFNDGGETPDETVNYDIDNEAGLTLLTPDDRTGYEFAGWQPAADVGNWDDATTYEAGASLTGRYGSVTLVAQWDPLPYAITYHVGAKTGSGEWETYGVTGYYGQPTPDTLTEYERSKPATAQYTYTFLGWAATEAEALNGELLASLPNVTGDADYWAVYGSDVNAYTINFYTPRQEISSLPGDYQLAQTGNVAYGAVPALSGDEPTLAASGTDYTWKFIGWATTQQDAVNQVNLVGKTLPAVTGGADYYAAFRMVYEPVEVYWVYEGAPETPELWDVGELPTHDDPVIPDSDGYYHVFREWDPAVVVVERNHAPYYYTALFDDHLQTYHITLKLNGGATDAPLTYDYTMGTPIAFPEPTKTGYRFTGWLLDAAAGTWTAGTVVPAGDYSTNTLWGDVSFTAQWEPITYTITFNPASEFDVLPESRTYTIESTGTITALAGEVSREGHSLNGWLVSVGGGSWTQGDSFGADYALNNSYGNITLTPIWDVNTYTLTWKSSDEYIQTSTAEYGSAIISYTPLSRVGYTADWDREVPVTMPAEDLVFTAVYHPVQYYIRLNVNGGDPMDNFYYTIDGAEVAGDNKLPEPTRTGATFTGWKVSAAEGNWVRNSVLPAYTSLNGRYGNVTLTAQWDLERHTVIWVAGDETRTTIWLYGATPSFSGTPTKAPDDSYSYDFIGWSLTEHGELLDHFDPVVADITYYAQFAQSERRYRVTWIVKNSEPVTQEYLFGQTPVYGDGTNPANISTEEYDFTFIGWEPAIAPVAGDVIYTAQYEITTKVQSLWLDVASLFLDIGANETVTAHVLPADATYRSVKWTSLDEDIATIDRDTGEITAVKNGIARIKASSVDERFNVYCVVTVKPTHTHQLVVSAGGVSTTQLPGAMLQLTATLAPENATYKDIVWRSGNITVATVDSTGLVKFIGVGETDITAEAADGFAIGSIHVVTTTDESEVEDDVKTYLITFGEFNAGFRFAEGGELYQSGRIYVAEGDSLTFKLNVSDARQSGYSVYANTAKLSYGEDYWYTLEDIHNNTVVSFKNSAAGVGVPEDGDDIVNIGGDSGMGFFQRIAAFFRKIVEFFRGIFH